MHVVTVLWTISRSRCTMASLRSTYGASLIRKSSLFVNRIGLENGLVQQRTWQGVGVSTQVDGWLGLFWQTEQLRRRLFKQLLDAPAERCLITDYGLVQWRGASLPGRFYIGNKPLGPLYCTAHIQHFHACEPYCQ